MLHTRPDPQLEKIYGEMKSRGKRIFPGWPVGAEVAGPNGAAAAIRRSFTTELRRPK